MTFQFQCPQGHLLEGDESQAGQQCQCPVCSTLFLIPAPPSYDAQPESFSFSPGPTAGVPEFFPGRAEAPAFPDVRGGHGAFDPTGVTSPQLLHIPCPNGHELEVPPDMLNQEVMCPHCGAQFLLRERDSAEHKRRKQEELERREYKIGKTWFTWAIVIAIVVLSGLIAMIALSQG